MNKLIMSRQNTFLFYVELFHTHTYTISKWMKQSVSRDEHGFPPPKLSLIFCVNMFIIWRKWGETKKNSNRNHFEKEFAINEMKICILTKHSVELANGWGTLKWFFFFFILMNEEENEGKYVWKREYLIFCV